MLANEAWQSIILFGMAWLGREKRESITVSACFLEAGLGIVAVRKPSEQECGSDCRGGDRP
jgi:hypothetical protein